MNNTLDLNLETEMLPFFDHTLNPYARQRVLQLLQTPLRSVAAIQNRQAILRGFARNLPHLLPYQYSPVYLNEVHQFLTVYPFEDLSEDPLQFRFFTPRLDKYRYQNRTSQLILLFHRLESYYFTPLNLEDFPENYQLDLAEMINFLAELDLEFYANKIKEDKFRDRHVIQLTRILFDMREKEEIERFFALLFEFEAYLSIQQTLSAQQFSFPQFNANHLKLQGFYHPLLKQPITNDLETATNVILLNGSNMAGKSTLLKAISLCVYLGHLGLGVPAAAAELRFFANFSIAINRRDDLQSGYSHFMTEIVNLKQVVKAAQQAPAFAVFDELFSGTNEEDATEICTTTLQGLTKFSDSLFFISTHLQGLKHLPDPRIEKYYLVCQLKDGVPVFTYQVQPGWSEIKIGQLLFEKEGLNALLA